MKNAKIVLVAAWDGWCGPCGTERPLVLTRTGRLGLRCWLTAPVDETRPLTLTCRLCGSSAPVPHEADDPPVELSRELDPAASVDLPAAAAVPASDSALFARLPASDDSLTALLPSSEARPSGVPLAAPAVGSTAVAGPAALPTVDVELDRARSAVGTALAALLAQRTAAAAAPAVPVVAAPAVPLLAPPASAAPLLPLQRSSSADEALHLLAEGIDLLATSRP